jgi:predicted TIM-barrel fold metal-dependent hydrolase
VNDVSEARDESSRYVVISSDCHAGADVLDYKPYLASQWHEEFDVWASHYVDPWLEIEPGLPGRRVGVASGNLVENWDSDRRIADLEADGIVAEVVFPNTSPPFFPSGNLSAPMPVTRQEYERRWAGLQAHNRWLVDFCAAAPGRRAGIAQILLNDVDAAMREIRWVKENGLSGGILLPGVSPGSGMPPLYSPEYEGIWAVCEELAVPVNHHAGPTGRPIDPPAPASSAIASFETHFFAQRALWHLIFAGVFERYPALRFILTETFTSWVTQRLPAADVLYASALVESSPWQAFAGVVAEKMSLSPREYFDRNCFIGASFLLPSEAQQRYEVGVGRIMWGSDYPHSEGCFPYSVKALRAAFADVPPAEVRRMVGETAAGVYSFDLDALALIAERVGPTVEEVATPLTDRPKVPEESVCAVFAPTMPIGPYA